MAEVAALLAGGVAGAAHVHAPSILVAGAHLVVDKVLGKAAGAPPPLVTLGRGPGGRLVAAGG